MITSYSQCMDPDKSQKSIMIPNPPEGADQIFNLKANKKVYRKEGTEVTKYIQLFMVDGTMHRSVLLYDKKDKKLSAMRSELEKIKNNRPRTFLDFKLVRVKKIKVNPELVQQVFDFLEQQVKKVKQDN